MSARRLYELAAEAAGVEAPRRGVPLWVMDIAASVSDAVNGVLRRDNTLSRTSVRLMHIMPPLDHGKAERELGWQPGSVDDAIRRAAEFYLSRRRRRAHEDE